MYYPAFLDLSDSLCVVIGGNKHALAKVRGLMDVGAEVTVIAETIVDELSVLIGRSHATWIERAYHEGDLTGAVLAVSTLMDPTVNRRIHAEAKKHNILLNAMDDVQNCSFIAPSIVRRSDLTVAISTSGKAPALAVRLREDLEARLGVEYARFLELAGTIRQDMVERFPDFEIRRRCWYELVDSDILELLKQGRVATAHQRVDDILGKRELHNEVDV